MDILDIGLYASYIMIVVALLAAIILPLISAAGNPKSLAKSGLGVGIILVLFFISYAISDNEVNPVYERFGIGEFGSKLIGGSLITIYLLMLLLIISVVYSEIAKFFK